MTTEPERVREFWSRPESTSERYGRGIHWVESKTVMEYINEQISGSREIGWLQYACERILVPLNRELAILSLGCGTGALERQLHKHVRCAYVDAFDISESTIQQAKESAAKEGLSKVINYQISDLNAIELMEDRYDVIFSNSCLHHIKVLEHLLSECARALRTGGYLIANEYIGPSRFQLPPDQVGIIDDLLVLLPERYKKRMALAPGYKLHFSPPDPTLLASTDPSEAIRSHEILRAVGQYLKIIEMRPYGGCILHMLLQDIAGNFEDGDPRLRALVDIERRLVRCGYLQSDFAFFVATKQSAKGDAGSREVI